MPGSDRPNPPPSDEDQPERRYDKYGVAFRPHAQYFVGGKRYGRHY